MLHYGLWYHTSKEILLIHESHFSHGILVLVLVSSVQAMRQYGNSNEILLIPESHFSHCSPASSNAILPRRNSSRNNLLDRDQRQWKTSYTGPRGTLRRPPTIEKPHMWVRKTNSLGTLHVRQLTSSCRHGGYS